MGRYYYLYYVEVNLICILTLALLLYRLVRYEFGNRTDTRVFKRIIVTIMLFCTFNLVSGLFRGRDFKYCNTILYISNMCYFEMLTLIGYLWMKYIYVRFSDHDEWLLRKWWICQIPIIIVTLLLITNPYTHLIFEIQEFADGLHNIYKRGPLLWLYWSISYIYIIIPTVKVIVKFVNEKNIYRRRSIIPYSLFIILPVITCIMEMIFVGTTFNLVGFTLSCLMIFLRSQQDQISNDELTGLNNRRELDRYLTEKVSIQNDDASVFLLMIDIDRFKSINDTYGHMIGDEALILVSCALKNVTNKCGGKVFLARYGGDEFVICGIDKQDDEIYQIKQLIHDEVEAIAIENKLDYKLQVSIGYMSGKRSEFPTSTDLFIAADKMMYYNKSKKK